MTNENKLFLIKSNTREVGSDCRNNARMNGRTVMWVLKDAEGIPYFDSRRKRDCVEILEWVEEGGWDWEGDLQLSFDQRKKR